MTAITIDRAVVAQALEALEYGGLVKKQQALTALRAAFAQPSARQVSPAAFAEIVKGREEIVGVPVYWAQWPTEVQK